MEPIIAQPGIAPSPFGGLVAKSYEARFEILDERRRLEMFEQRDAGSVYDVNALDECMM
jgi:hypothetical protein